jgi:hypothetical protein
MEQRPTPAPATFKVQKGILTSRSEIFAAMFSHGFSEGETGNLHISDMTPQVHIYFTFSFTMDKIFEKMLDRFCSYNKAKVFLEGSCN